MKLFSLLKTKFFNIHVCNTYQLNCCTILYWMVYLLPHKITKIIEYTEKLILLNTNFIKTRPTTFLGYYGGNQNKVLLDQYYQLCYKLMVLVLIEWLKGLLSISWNQRNTQQKQIFMVLASIKFRQPIEINYGKKCVKGKRAWRL